MNEDVQIAFNLLLVDRNIFESRAYDYLVQNVIPDDFWEPVTISLTLQEISEFEKVSHSDECAICNEDLESFLKLSCCNQEMCENCTKKWFSSSVKCPFCVQDLRNYLKK